MGIEVFQSTNGSSCESFREAKEMNEDKDINPSMRGST
jgi:hypothetical protein